MTPVRFSDYQFALKPTLFGIVMMFREAVPANGVGDFEWGRWRRANWKDMTRFTPEKLK